MENEFIQTQMRVCKYLRKKDTATSYYYLEGDSLLPNRVSISKENITNVQKKGRNLQPTAGTFVSKYTKKEESILKQHPPFHIRTQIWKIEEYPQLIGYGTCGISNKQGKTQDIGDLMIFHSDDNWETITIYYFIGMGNPDFQEKAFEYAASII